MEQLTTYELLDLFATYGNAAGGHFMNFVTVFFAYVVVGYLIAEKLNRATYLFIAILYSVFMLLPASGSFTVLLPVLDISEELASREDQIGANTIGLAKMLSGTGGIIMIVMNPLLQFVAYVGSIVFVHKSRSASGAPNAT